jgi:hypothetical protein
MSYETKSPKHGGRIESGVALSTLVFDLERDDPNEAEPQPEAEPVQVDPAADTLPELPATD